MSSGDSKRQAKRPYVLQFCNINSIRNKTPQLRSSLLFSKYSAFLSFVETHLGKDDQAPKLPGFVAHPFNHTNRSSGICFYSANDIACKPVCHPPVCVDGNMCVTMQIKLRGIAINVCFLLSFSTLPMQKSSRRPLPPRWDVNKAKSLLTQHN